MQTDTMSSNHTTTTATTAAKRLTPKPLRRLWQRTAASRAWATLVGCVFTCLVAALVPTSAAARNRVVLITHPRAHVLKNYVALIKAQVLPGEGLELWGIYHATETEDYSDAERYIKEEGADFISLHRLTCPLKRDQAFAGNGCRETFRALFDQSDGLILNGGPDIPPDIYGQPTLLLSQISAPMRHVFEVALLYQFIGGKGAGEAPATIPATKTATPAAPATPAPSPDANISIAPRKPYDLAEPVEPFLASRPDYPVMAICVGLQTLNVALGGTLIQDIPHEVYHIDTIEQGKLTDAKTWHRGWETIAHANEYVARGAMHPLRLTAAAPSLWRTTLGGDHLSQVLSVHHQAIDALGHDLVVWATSEDGKIIEGIGHRSYSHVIGVQFHPEQSMLFQKPSTTSVVPGKLSQDKQASSFHLMLWKTFADYVEHQTGHQAPRL